MRKILITIDGEMGIIAETNFSKEEIESAAEVIYEDAQKHDIYLDEENIVKELEKKGYFKSTGEEAEIQQFYL